MWYSVFWNLKPIICLRFYIILICVTRSKSLRLDQSLHKYDLTSDVYGDTVLTAPACHLCYEADGVFMKDECPCKARTEGMSLHQLLICDSIDL